VSEVGPEGEVDVGPIGNEGRDVVGVEVHEALAELVIERGTLL
jgi:hypothetical protein